MKKIKRKQPKYNTDSNGNRFWYKNNKRHREDGPAIEYINGDKHWYKNGELHREDGPAIEWNNGDKEWYNKGRSHREGGPAEEFANGDKQYWLNGHLHRENAPAIEYISGYKVWYINGKRHREDGPAVEYPNGNKEYWLNGNKVEKEDLPINKEKELLIQEEWPKCSVDESGNKVWKNEKGQYHRKDGPAIECINDYKAWLINGKYHRKDGPAVEYSNGTKEYWLNGSLIKEKDLPMNKNKKESKCKILKDGTKKWYKGNKRHRENGPAVEYTNGNKEYWINGNLHREDGPAIERSDGYKEYWLNGNKVQKEDLPINKKKEIIKEEWPKCTIQMSGNKEWQNKEGYRHRLDGPAYEGINGDKAWWVNGKLHREDGPAIEFANGDKEWYINGKKHREDGPACEYANGCKYYYLNGKEVKEKDLPINQWPKCSIDESGNKEWINEKGIRHREDGPAWEGFNGDKSWWVNGLLHREDKPAIEWANGDKFWYKNGLRHREDGSAIEYADGRVDYYLHGKLVEEKDLPINQWPKCTIQILGNKEWKNKEGELHRLDGPAWIGINGDKAWYKDGNLHRENGPANEWHNGHKEWYKNGELHREDGPACEYANGNKSWWLNGLLHREDGPAIEKKNEKKWYINGKLHREDGPAVELNNGRKEYWLNDKVVEEKDLPINIPLDKEIKSSKLEKIDLTIIDTSTTDGWEYLQNISKTIENSAPSKINDDLLKLIQKQILNCDGIIAIPTKMLETFHKEKIRNIIKEENELNEQITKIKYIPNDKTFSKEEWPKCITSENGTKRWENKDGFYHRLDGPAYEGKNGDKEYWINGKLHREDGPACEYANGDKYYYLNGIKVEEKDLPINKKEEWPKCTIDKDENKEWKNEQGYLHREGGPAIECSNGDKFWYKNNKIHREDGPAVECSNGNKEYWLNDKQVKEKDLPINKNKKKIIRYKVLKNRIKEEWPKCTIDKSGNKIWKNKEGLLHREGGPAIECADGDKFWYINGESHRENGPAMDRANGDKSWYKEDKLHREDGPAVECSNGDKEYWLHGNKVEEKDLPINKEKELIKEEWPKCTIDKDENKEWKNEQGYLHREGGPAIECSNGDKFWYINGKCHREDGPAVECSNGDKYWYKNNKIHREDGPARECANGDKYWYKNGELHRENGPAKVYANGTTEYWTNGQLNNRHFEITGVDYNILNDLLNKIYMKPENINKYKENEIKMEELNFAPNRIKINTTPITSDTDEWPKYSVDTYGNKRWVNKNGLYNREDGPAIEYSYGTKEWWINGKLHRENKPAIECFNGDKYWYKNDKLHREDGPAMEYANGFKAYYLNGEKVEEKDLPMNKKEEWPKCEIDQFGSKMWKNKEGLYHRENGPAVENINGDKEWYVNGQLHREDGPACEYANGDNLWYINGKEHREDGPAVEFKNGYKVYYLNGEKVEEKDLPMNKKEEWPKCEIDQFGSKMWKNEKGQLHRLNGPAVENINGHKAWYKNGLKHREDGPACEYANGSKEWYKNGLKHREDGPAGEYVNRRNEYWLNANKVEEKEWYINGLKHREDGPAIEYASGTKEYWLNNIKVEKKDLPINKDIKKVIQQPLNSPESHIISGNHVTVPEFEIISSPTIQIADIKARCNVDSLMQKIQQEIIDKEDSDCFAAFIETKLTDIPQKENKVLKMIKQDGTKASYRIVSKQMTKMVKNSILQIIKTANPSAKSQISSVSKFLDTDVGKSFISFILGLGLGNTPKIKDNKHMIKICKELRVEGMSTAGNFIINEVLKNVIPLISNKEKLRIESVSVEEQIVSDELITDEQIEEKKSELI